MNLEESLRRRISSILGEVERRGFEAVVFLNEVIGQNPSNFVYVSGPWGLGDEHNTLVFDVDGSSTLVFPHWGATISGPPRRLWPITTPRRSASTSPP